MPGWRVMEWDRARGVGRVAGEVDARTISLDVTRSDVLVDDLFLGEEVELVLEADDSDAIVAREIAPHAWREDGPLLAVDASDVPEPLTAAVARLTRALGPHARLQIASAREDVFHFEAHDVDWPPPVTPPIAKVTFEGVSYVKGPSFSEGYVRASVVSWRRFRAHRQKVLRYWSLSTDIVPDDAYVFRFEPARFRETAGYVIAATIDVALDPNMARRSL